MYWLLFREKLYRHLILHYKIYADNTHVFEETMLKMAGIETKPTECRFRSSDDTNIFIVIKGLTASDVVTFKAYLATFDANVIYDETYSKFSIDAKIAETQILPEFISYLARMKKEAQQDKEKAALFKFYQDKSVPKYNYYLTCQTLLALTSHDELILRANNEKLTPEENQRMNEYNLTLYKSAKQDLLDNFLILAYCGAYGYFVTEEIRINAAKRNFVAICNALNLPLEQTLASAQKPNFTSNDNTAVDLIATAIYQEDLRHINSLLALTSKKGLGLPADMQRVIMNFYADKYQTTAKFVSVNKDDDKRVPEIADNASQENKVTSSEHALMMTKANKLAKKHVKLTVMPGSPSPDIVGRDTYANEFFRFFSDAEIKTRRFTPTTNYQEIAATAVVSDIFMRLEFEKIYRCKNEIIAISRYGWNDTRRFTMYGHATAKVIIEVDHKLPVRHYMLGMYNKEDENQVRLVNFTRFITVDALDQIKLPDDAELVHDSTPKASAYENAPAHHLLAKR